MSNALYLLNEKKKDDENRKIFVAKNEKNYTNEMDESVAYAIYIQSIQKIIKFLNDAIHLTKQINDKSSSEDERIKANATIFDKVEKIDLILSEFTKLFSVVRDISLKDIYHQLYIQFCSISIQAKLFFLKRDIKYAENAIKISEYLCKMFSLLEQQAKKENKEEKIVMTK